MLPGEAGIEAIRLLWDKFSCAKLDLGNKKSLGIPGYLSSLCLQGLFLLHFLHRHPIFDAIGMDLKQWNRDFPGRSMTKKIDEFPRYLHLNKASASVFEAKLFLQDNSNSTIPSIAKIATASHN